MAGTAELAALQGESLGGIWADLDGNGLPDLILCMIGSGVKIFLNTGQGRFMDATGICALPLPREATAVAVNLCDVNGDAAPDLSILLADGRFRVLTNRWHADPASAWLRVQPTAPASRIVLLDPTSRLAVASARLHAVGGGAVTRAATSADFGVAHRDAATIVVHFADGRKRTMSWSKGTPANGILKVTPEAPTP